MFDNMVPETNDANSGTDVIILGGGHNENQREVTQTGDNWAAWFAQLLESAEEYPNAADENTIGFSNPAMNEIVFPPQEIRHDRDDSPIIALDDTEVEHLPGRSELFSDRLAALPTRASDSISQPLEWDASMEIHRTPVNNTPQVKIR
jgi:hypothetical protein